MTILTFENSLWKGVWEVGEGGVEAGRTGRRPRLMFDGVNYQAL